MQEPNLFMEDELMFLQYPKKESVPTLLLSAAQVQYSLTLWTNWRERFFKDTGPILYCSLVICHPATKKPPNTIVEMFSRSHSLPILTFFLLNFHHDMLGLCQGRSTIPAHLEVDLTWASLHSCLRGLYDESLESHFDHS